jgi:glutamyl-tRNA reductase
VPTIRELRERAEGILERELSHARGVEEEVLRRFGRRLVKKILHQPTVRLRDGAAEGGDSFLALARELFGLDEETHGDEE